MTTSAEKDACQHEWIERGSGDLCWRECWLCGEQTPYHAETGAAKEGAARVVAAVQAAAEREHAGGCTYQHQQGQNEDCNSCTAARIQEAVLSAVRVHWEPPTHAEAARKEADRIYEGEPGYAIPPAEHDCTCGFLRDPSDPHSPECMGRATRDLPPGQGAGS